MIVAETCIERITDSDYCSVYTGERKFVNQLMRYKEQYPDEIKIIDYKDGYVLAHVPFDWLRFVKPPTKRNFTEEQRQALSDNMKKARAKRNNGGNDEV